MRCRASSPTTRSCLRCSAIASRDAQIVAWDVDGIDWDGFDLVVIRSTWNYTSHYDQTSCSGPTPSVKRLQNPPALVRWNSDKRYLGDLADAGLAVVETITWLPATRPQSTARSS